MTVQQLIDSSGFSPVNASGDAGDRAISGVYCCDLLSIAMGHAPADCAWVTVMANMNTLADAALADVACVVLAEGAALDDASAEKAKLQGITVLSTDLPVFDAALRVHTMLR